MHDCFACMYVYASHAYLVHTEIRKVYWISWNCNYRGLLACMWVLGTEPLQEHQVLLSIETYIHPQI